MAGGTGARNQRIGGETRGPQVGARRRPAGGGAPRRRGGVQLVQYYAEGKRAPGAWTQNDTAKRLQALTQTHRQIAQAQSRRRCCVKCNSPREGSARRIMRQPTHRRQRPGATSPPRRPCVTQAAWHVLLWAAWQGLQRSGSVWRQAACVSSSGLRTLFCLAHTLRIVLMSQVQPLSGCSFAISATCSATRGVRLPRVRQALAPSHMQPRTTRTHTVVCQKTQGEQMTCAI